MCKSFCVCPTPRAPSALTHPPTAHITPSTKNTSCSEKWNWTKQVYRMNKSRERGCSKESWLQQQHNQPHYCTRLEKKKSMLEICQHQAPHSCPNYASKLMAPLSRKQELNRFHTSHSHILMIILVKYMQLFGGCCFFCFFFGCCLSWLWLVYLRLQGKTLE